MFIKLKSNVIYRNYESFGYITDNRNFGYKQINNKEDSIGDKIISETGTVFLSILSKDPQTLDELTKKIKKIFIDVDEDIIKSDAREFYLLLERDGFIVTGRTLHECKENDTPFSYSELEPQMIKKNFSEVKIHTELSTQEFLEEYFDNRPQLTNLHIEIISKCNERCLHCYIPHDNKISSMNPNLFYNIIEQCKDMKLIHLTLSGGEPMLHKNFTDFLRKCRENDFSVNILSNLTLLNDEFIKEMSANPLLGVQVSLYSMDPNIHDEITQVKGSFQKTKNAILKLIDNNIPLQISCPILKQNKNRYTHVVKWAKSHKINVGDDYGIIAKYDHTTQNLNSRLSIDEIREVIEDKFSRDSKYFEQIEFEAKKKKNIESSDFVCSVCHSSICIAENGNVYPCAGWQDYIVGNVQDNSLSEIWENSEKVKYLRGLRNHDFPECIECSDKEFCTMCMVRNANENPFGDPLVVNEYFCDIARLNKQMVLEWKCNQMS